LRDRLLKENKGKLVMWLQQVLIECCFVKLSLTSGKDDNEELTPKSIMEPTPYHCICKSSSRAQSNRK
jgi:timeless